MGATFLQGVNNYTNYKDCALAYHYCLSIIFRDFNQAELDVLLSTSLLLFYGKCNKNGKKVLKDVFQSTYYQVK